MANKIKNDTGTTDKTTETVIRLSVHTTHVHRLLAAIEKGEFRELGLIDAQILTAGEKSPSTSQSRPTGSTWTSKHKLEMPPKGANELHEK